jgi:hypothetical protein
MSSSEADEERYDPEQESENEKPRAKKPKASAAGEGGGTSDDDKQLAPAAAAGVVPATRTATTPKGQPQLTHRLFEKPTARSAANRMKSRQKRERQELGRVPIARGSVAHIIHSRLGTLDESLLVDWSPASTAGAATKETGTSSSTAGGGAVLALAAATKNHQPHGGDGGGDGRSDLPSTSVGTSPKRPLRICYRSTVMPISSSRIPREFYRVVVVEGKHKGKTGTFTIRLDDGRSLFMHCSVLTRSIIILIMGSVGMLRPAGFVIKETLGKNSIIELDDRGKRITVSNLHIRTKSTTPDNAHPYSNSPFKARTYVAAAQQNQRQSPQSSAGEMSRTEALLQFALEEQTKR